MAKIFAKSGVSRTLRDSSEEDGRTEHDGADACKKIGLGLTIGEIAERLGISEKAARALVKASSYCLEPPLLPDSQRRSN
jgi:hypothetical protein